MAKRKSKKLGRKVRVKGSTDQAGPRPAVPSEKPIQSQWQRVVARRNQQEGLPIVPLTDYVGWLILAAEHGVLDEVSRFVDLGADVNAQHDLFFGHTPLSLAANKGDVNVVRYLVEHGADVNHATEAGSTPLTIAAQSGNLEVVKYLVEHGADVNHVGTDGDALTCAVQ